MRRTIVVLVVLGLIGYTGFVSLFGSGGSWHQKLTLTVETPAGEVSGAAVSKIRYSCDTTPSGLTGREVSYDLTGEATVVEVLPGRYLFALLDDSKETFARAAKDRFEGMKRCDWLRQIPRQTEPVTLTGDTMPMLVTFDDITKPETVRLVDPDDLDAAFGCAHEAAQSNYPWRVAGVTYQAWLASEVVRLSREMASEKSGLTGPVGDAITELHFITDDHNYNAADELRMAELRTHFSEQQLSVWRDARYTLEQELPATLPTPQSVAAGIGGPCHQLTSVTLEITPDVLTDGRVEGVLAWLGPYPEPALGPATGGTTNIPFYRLVDMGDFIMREQ